MVKNKKAVWEEFSKNHEHEFRQRMGYGFEKINKIGKDKFLEAMDWNSPSDVAKWNTDALKIVPCSECDNEFVTYQMELGLCPKCSKKYDLKAYDEALQIATDLGLIEPYIILANFYFVKNFREQFKKRNTKETIDYLVKNNLEGFFCMNKVAEFMKNEIDFKNLVLKIEKKSGELSEEGLVRFNFIKNKLYLSSNDYRVRLENLIKYQTKMEGNYETAGVSALLGYDIGFLTLQAKKTSEE